MTDTNNQVGAGGGEETVTGAFIRGFGEGALDGLNQMGDAAFFKHFQRSGQLNHMPTAADGTPRPNGGHEVYPADVHTNPEYGQLLHFDIYFKENPRMEDITSAVGGFFGSAKDLIGDLYSGVADASGEAADGTIVNQEGGFDISGLGDYAGDMFNQGLIKFVNTLKESSTLPEFVNEEIIKDTRFGKADAVSDDKITLYLPGELKNADTLSYQEHGLGVLKGLADGNLSSFIPGIVNKFAGLVDGISDFAGVELNTANTINALTGAVRNPRAEQMFENVGFRTFEFNFNFRPKNETEAKAMLTICKLFRFHSHPEINASKAFYLVPSEFQISYLDVRQPSPLGDITSNQSPGGGYAMENHWINKMGRCALTNVTVDYHPNGVSTTFENGIPTAIDLNLSFTEMEPISRNHIEAGF